MDRHRVVADLRRFYSEANDEDVTPHGRLEFARTRELLERSLPTPPARVARSGAVIAAVAIGRYAGLLEFGADGGLTSVTAPLVEGVLASGRHDPRLGVTTAYVHRPEELVDEFADAGLTDVSVYACSGSSRCAP